MKKQELFMTSFLTALSSDVADVDAKVWYHSFAFIVFLTVRLDFVLLYYFDNVAALNALRRKKRLDKQLQQIDGTLSTIEFQREALENAQTNTEVLKNMGFAAKALKAAHQQLLVRITAHVHNNYYTCRRV